MREQAGWQEHAAFMNGLVDAGFLVLGGPLEGGRETLHICAAPSEKDVRARFAEDPWAPSGTIVVKSVEGWTIVLCPPALDEILANAPRAAVDVYSARSERQIALITACAADGGVRLGGYDAATLMEALTA